MVDLDDLALIGVPTSHALSVVVPYTRNTQVITSDTTSPIDVRSVGEGMVVIDPAPEVNQRITLRDYQMYNKKPPTYSGGNHAHATKADRDKQRKQKKLSKKRNRR